MIAPTPDVVTFARESFDILVETPATSKKLLYQVSFHSPSVHRHIFWIAANTWPVRAGTMNGGATRTPSADANIVCKSRGSAMRIDNSAMLRAQRRVEPRGVFESISSYQFMLQGSI